MAVPGPIDRRASTIPFIREAGRADHRLATGGIVFVGDGVYGGDVVRLDISVTT
jgi:hypothetical protein